MMQEIAMSTSEILNRFLSGLIYVVLKVKNDFDADPFNLNRNAVRAVVSIWILKTAQTIFRCGHG